MKRGEIEALVRAHRGRARAVAFLHVLRQPALEEDDQAFLDRNAGELTVADLLRWRARTPPLERAPILVQLARIGEETPMQFEHELLNAPGLSLDEREWDTLIDLLRGKVPATIFQRLESRNARPPAAAPSGDVLAFKAPANEGPVDLASMLDLDDGPAAAPSPGGDALGGDALGGDLFGDGGGSLGDALGLDLGGDDAGGPLFADPFAGLTKETGLTRARAATSGEECAMLLEWLEAQGVATDTLLGIALEALGQGRIASPLLAFVGKKLGTTEAWQAHGPALFGALVARKAFAEMQDFLAQRASSEGSAATAEAAEAALGHALIDAARDALKHKDEAHALCALSGLSCLEPIADLKRRYPALKQAAVKASAGRDALVLIDLNLRLAREAPVKGMPLESMIAAVHALSDALG